MILKHASILDSLVKHYTEEISREMGYIELKDGQSWTPEAVVDFAVWWMLDLALIHDEDLQRFVMTRIAAERDSCGAPCPMCLRRF